MNIIEVQAVNDAVLARANVEGPDRTYTVVFLYSREEYEGHLGQTLSRWTCRMTGATYKVLRAIVARSRPMRVTCVINCSLSHTRSCRLT
jgi:hypothetical protein